MKYSISAFCALTILAASGCSKAVPSCGDLQSLDLVKQIAVGELANQVGAEGARAFNFSVNAIRTTNTNEKTGAHECAAQMSMKETSSGSANDFPITYTVELTDNGEQLFVNVIGL